MPVLIGIRDIPKSSIHIIRPSGELPMSAASSANATRKTPSILIAAAGEDDRLKEAMVARLQDANIVTQC